MTVSSLSIQPDLSPDHYYYHGSATITNVRSLNVSPPRGLVPPVCRWTSASGKTFERLPFRCTNKISLRGGDEVNIRASPEERVIRCPPTRLEALVLSGGSNLTPKGFAESSIVVPTDFQPPQIL